VSTDTKSQCKQSGHVTSGRKQKHYDESSSDADDFDYVINDSRRALDFTRSAMNSTRNVASSVRIPLTFVLS